MSRSEARASKKARNWCSYEWWTTSADDSSLTPSSVQRSGSSPSIRLDQSFPSRITPCAADEVDPEVVGLIGIHHGGDLADGAVREPEDRHRRGGVLVPREDRVVRPGRVAADLLHGRAHERQERIDGVAAHRQEAAPATDPEPVPFVLRDRRPDLVVVVDLGVVERPDQVALEEAAGGGELWREADVEADAGLALRSPRRPLVSVAQLLDVEGDGLLDDEMLPGARRSDGLRGVQVAPAARGPRRRCPAARAVRRGPGRARWDGRRSAATGVASTSVRLRADGHDLDVRDLLERGEVRSGRPAIPDQADSPRHRASRPVRVIA